MAVLVVNAGSSSLKLDVLDPRTGDRLASKRIERVEDHREALAEALPELTGAHPVVAVGHRVVHGGDRFQAPTLLDDTVIAAIEALVPLAPLHNPANLAGIHAARALLPELPHVAVFDTAFHATLPRRAHTYALPREVAQAHRIRRYGFHGPSHRFVAEQAAAFLECPLEELRLVTCHLGNGASVAAVELGRSVDTSMGMTPLEGLVMGTRSGDLDPGAVLALARAGYDVDALDTLLNRESGLAGLSGTSGDLRDIEARAAEGDDDARLAINVAVHRLRKYLGAYAAVMGGLDVIVLTGGIGENGASFRRRMLQRLEFLGVRLDEDRNLDARVDRTHPVFEISTPRSRVKVLVVATDEARAIAAQTQELVEHNDVVDEALTIPIEVSARHLHLTQEAVETLFGPGHTLTPAFALSQPGQFACEERVTLVGPKRRIERVRVLGPVRPACQVEISRTDEFFLGVDAPVRASGKVAASAPIRLEGPAGTLDLAEGLICAWRHIHMTTADAARFGVKDKDVVEVAIDSDGRDLIFGDVLVRVKDSYALAMHIDTDEANAAELSRDTAGMLVDTGAFARLRRRRV